MSIVLMDLPFFQIIFSQLILTKGGCEWYGLQWDGGFVMSCNPELQYKMAIVSMVQMITLTLSIALKNTFLQKTTILSVVG